MNASGLWVDVITENGKAFRLTKSMLIEHLVSGNLNEAYNAFMNL